MFSVTAKSRYTNTAEGVMTEATAPTACPAGLRVPPSFSNNSTLNKDKLPLLDTSSVWKGTALRRTTLVYRPSYVNKGSPEKKLDLFSDLS